MAHRQRREIEKIFAQAQMQVEKELKPLEDVARAIVQASTACRDAVRDLIHGATEKERLEREAFVFYEFIYFFMHLTMRHASTQLAESQLRTLQRYLGPLISSVAIDSYFAHWPDDLKQKMTSEFYDKLNEAESEYTECTQAGSLGQGEDSVRRKLRALFMKLGSNISSLSGRAEKELAVITPVALVAISEWKRMRLDNLMAQVEKASR